MPNKLTSWPPRLRVACLAAIPVGGGLLLSGCAAVGPDFGTPEAAVAGAWSESGAPGVTAGRKDLVAWWKVFKDPVLDRLVSKASKQNLSLKQAAKPGAYVPAGVRKKMEARTDWGEMLGSPAERPPASTPASKRVRKRVPGKVGG